MPCAQSLAQGRAGGAATTVSLALASKSENPARTLNQDFYPLSKTAPNPKDGLEQALARFKMAMATKDISVVR
jgi:hypothetical protein